MRSQLGILFGLLGASLPPERGTYEAQPPRRPLRLDDIREAAPAFGRQRIEADFYTAEVAPRQRQMIIGDLRRTHGWSPANEGRACRCERCVRRRRHHAGHRGAR